MILLTLNCNVSASCLLHLTCIYTVHTYVHTVVVFMIICSVKPFFLCLFLSTDCSSWSPGAGCELQGFTGSGISYGMHHSGTLCENSRVSFTTNPVDQTLLAVCTLVYNTGFRE